MSKIQKSYLNRVRKVDEIPSFAKKAAANLEYQKRVAVLRKQGAIPLTEIGENFTKISWDLFKKNSPEPDAGSIWQVTKIKNANGEEESWLVVYTDDNDKIIRQVKASMKKEAQEEREYVSFEEGDSVRDFIDREGKVVSVAENTIRVILDEGKEVIRYAPSELTKISKKIAHTPGAIVQVIIPPGHINEKYNGKVGEVTAAVPDRSKISFKDLPPLWFEDNTIQEVVPCPMCQANISLQKLKKVGKIKCRCSAFYTWRQLEKIAKTAAINEKAQKKVKKISEFGVLSDETVKQIHKWADEIEHLIDEEDYEPNEAYLIEMEKVRDENWFVYLNARGALLNVLEERGITISPKIASIKTARIVEKGNEWCVIAESGRNMGCYPTKPEAEKRLKQVEMFKHMKGSKKTADLEPIMVGETVLYEVDRGRTVKGVVKDIDSEGYATLELEDGETINYVHTGDMEKVFAKKTAQNVIFWFDDPKALKNLRYLQGPPTSPAGEEPLERPEGLEGEEKPELEAGEVEKEASSKFGKFDSREFSNALYSLEDKIYDKYGEDFDFEISQGSGYGLDDHFENRIVGYIRTNDQNDRDKVMRVVHDTMQLVPLDVEIGFHNNKDWFVVFTKIEEEEEVEKEASIQKNAEDLTLRQLASRFWDIIMTTSIKYVGEDQQEQEWPVDLAKQIEADALESFTITYKEALTEDSTLLSELLEYMDRNYKTYFTKNASKKTVIGKIGEIVKESLEKEAQGGSSFEALRGGGGGASDQLEPMGWQVQETKTPKLPEQVPELREETEEIEEIVIRVSPEDKAVKIDFEGEKEEEVEKPVGAEAPPEKPIAKPKEELEEEEGLGEVPVNF